MIDLTLCIPAIRPHNWKRLCKSIQDSCTQYSYEILFIGPFSPCSDVGQMRHVHYIKDYSPPCRSAQIGLIQANGRLIHLPVDDGVFFPEALDQAITFYDQECLRKDVIIGRYREAALEQGDEFPLEYWKAGFHKDLRLPGIDPDWGISPQPLLSTDYLRDIGGWDCVFEYHNLANHDLAFRIQSRGGKYIPSPIETFNAGHMPARSGDHAPIHNSHIKSDYPLLKKWYSTPSNRYKIPLDNWEKAPTVWRRRFPNGIVNTYDAMIETL